MIHKDDGFNLNIRCRFPGDREYVFAFIALFTFLIIIYANSFQGQWIFDDTPNIIENKNIFLKTFNWSDIGKTFHGIQGKKLNRPLAYFSFALNYYFDGLNVFGFHLVNFIIHYLSSVFLFLFIYNTLKLPMVRERYGPTSYSIALLSAAFWATSPVQVPAVTYIVQRMASMAGLFYIMTMYFYFKGRMAPAIARQIVFFTGALLCAMLSFATKENAVLLPVSIWLYDLLLIQGATRENIIKNLKFFALMILIVAAVGLWYVDISSILSGAAYKNRPFTLTERLLTQPRIIIFYITLLLYPLGSRLTLLHDIEISTSLLTPWLTLPAFALIAMLLVLAGYIARKRPLISFCIFFFFLNHVVEGSFIPLELIYEHRSYIPSFFFFVPVAIVMLQIIDYFSYKRAIQFMMVAVFTFLLFAQGHTVFARNALFAHTILLWNDNVKKAPNLSGPYTNLASAYGNLGFHNKAYAFSSRALSLNRYANLLNRGIDLYNLGLYHLHVTGNFDLALGLFQSALEIYPGYGQAYHGAAVCLIRTGDLAKAERRLTTALSICPDNANLRHALGFVLLKTGEYDQAIKQSRQALLLNSDLLNALCVLGEASRKKGNERAATFYWERYIEKNPNDLKGNLALIELYARENKKDRLSQTIGKLMILKGSKSWNELMKQMVSDTRLMGYIPDPEAIISRISCAGKTNEK